MKKIYKSKISGLLLVLLILPISITSYQAIVDKNWWAFLFLLITSLFILHLFLTTDYTLDQNELYIRSGFIIHKRIAIKNISKIKKTNSWLSSPALSLDRIEVFYNQYDSTIISPKNKEDFALEIKKLNPEAEINLK